MPQTDEYGGVAVDESPDEFGGMPISDEEVPSIPAEEILSHPAIPSWIGPHGERPGEDILAPSNLSRWERFRNTPIGHSLLGPTEMEKEAELTPYNDPGIIPIARQMLKMTSVPPPIANEIRTLTQATVETPLLGETGKGIAKGLREVALNTPIAPFGAAGEIAMPLFAGEFAFSIPEQKAEYERALKEGRTEDAARIATEFAVGGALIGAGTKHEATRTLNRFKKNVEPTQAPTEAAAPPEPPVETRTQEVFNGKPVEVLEVNKKKGTALVRPEGQPDAAPDVVPYGEIETREVPVEKGPNASSQQEATAVYGDLRPSAGESPGEMPTAQGERGVQSQTGERVRQAEGQNREVPLTQEQLKENIIKERLKEGIEPKNLQITVNKPGGEEIPQASYVQVDDVTPGKNNPFSSNPEQMNQLGLKMPTKEELLKLPQGKYTLPEVQEMLRARQTLPLSEFKGEVPKNAVPIKVQRADGTTYEAFLVAAPGAKKAGTRIAKVKADTQGLSDGVLGKGDKIIEGPKTAAEYKAATEVSEPITKAQEQVSEVAKKEGKRSAKEIKAELITKLQQALQGAGEGPEKITIDIPGDGRFTIKNTIKAISDTLDAATRLDTSSGGPLKATSRREIPSEYVKRDFEDAVRLYGSQTEAFKRLSSQLARAEELGIDPKQQQRISRLLSRLDKNKGPEKEATPVGGSPAYAGFPLPNIAALGPAVKQALTNLNRTRKALQTIWKSSPNRNRMDQTIDAADNKANIAGREMGNRLRISTGRMERMATMAVVEANGDPQRLQQFEQQAIAGGNQEAVDAVRYAQREWTPLQADAARVTRILDGQIAAEQNAGIATEYRDAYIPHIYDRDLLMGSGRPFVIAGGTGMGSGFKKGRTFETIFDAIEQGYKPKTMDVADLVEHRVKVGQKIINRKQWAESLQTLTDPTDGNPLAAPLIRKSRGPGKPSYEVAPPGYRPMEILPGVRIGIHEAYLPLFRALTGESWVSGSVPGKLLLEAAGGIKHGLLVFDSFHASRIFQKLLTLAPGKVLSGKAGYKRGLSLLEYADSDLNAAVRENLITPEIATWVRANRANARMLIDSGLNVGRIQEGLYNSVVRQIPGIGPFNKWVFEKLTRGALMEAGLIELERVSAAKPSVPRGTIAAEVSRNLNAYFGNLGRQGIFKSASSRDIARLVALAPQWVESMARTEIKGAAQVAKGVTYDPIVHKTLLTGSIGKGVAQGLLAYFVGTQILNYITRGHSTFQNEEDNHKLDAWIPGPKGSHGFFLSPFSVVAELTHDMLRYSSKEPSKWDAAMRIAGNKASPLTRALKVLMTGRDYDGKQISDTWNRVKAAGIALAPTPIPLAPIVKGSQYPGQLQRQLTASAGFKTEPAESAAQQVAHKAQQFLQSKGKKPVALELTDEPAFYKLRDAIRKDDDTGAKEILDALRKTHSDLKIFKAMQGHMSRPFTDSLVHEGEFRRSLSPQQQELYRRARDEQREEFQKFKQLWYKRRER